MGSVTERCDTTLLPIEMIDEIFQFIGDGEDLLNAIKGLLLTKSYGWMFLRDNYLWRRLIKLHYPHHNACSSDFPLQTLMKLLRCFPNRLDKYQWDIANRMESLNAEHVCPITYVVGRSGEFSPYENVEPRLIKKLHDIEHVSCLTNPKLIIPTSEWVVNVLCNMEYACTTQGWRWALRTFVTEHFGGHIMRFLENRPPFWHMVRDSTTRKRLMNRSMVSLYLQECCFGGKYRPYDIYTERRSWE